MLPYYFYSDIAAEIYDGDRDFASSSESNALPLLPKANRVYVCGLFTLDSLSATEICDLTAVQFNDQRKDALKVTEQKTLEVPESETLPDFASESQPTQDSSYTTHISWAYNTSVLAEVFYSTKETTRNLIII